MDVRSIPLEELLPPLYPVRTHADDDKMRELVRSIATKGLFHPLTVTPEDGKYRILAGHRRLIAVRGLGWKDVPCSIMDLDGRKAEDITVEENLVREDVNDLDLGYFLKHICDREGLTQRQVAERYGHSGAWANRYIRLTKLDDDTQVALQEGVLEGRVALELQRVDNEDLRKVYTREAIVHEHSLARVRQQADVYQQHKRAIDQGVEVAQAIQEEQAVNPYQLRCFGCAIPADERPGGMYWLCAGCTRAIEEAAQRQAAAEQ
ncbi:Nucleoid occlusion protein [subsurface metagenome]